MHEESIIIPSFNLFGQLIIFLPIFLSSLQGFLKMLVSSLLFFLIEKLVENGSCQKHAPNYPSQVS